MLFISVNELHLRDHNPLHFPLIGTDHGLKANGVGWVLTVALIEGVDLASLASEGLSDPYVVLTCNAQTRSSSVKLQTSNPQWNGSAF